MGRPTGKWQGFILYDGQGAATTWQQYNLSRTYNLAGGVTSQSYPSGRTVNYSYDGAGRVSGFTGNLGDGVSRNYATGISYTAAGQMASEQFGTSPGLTHRMDYNLRQQLYQVQVGTGSSGNPMWDRGKLYTYYAGSLAAPTSEGTNNNGNVIRSDHYIQVPSNPNEWVLEYQEYNYDSLNRLTKTSGKLGGSPGSGWGWGNEFAQSFLYDRWGNRTIDQNPANTWGAGINKAAYTSNTATNRFNELGYDPVGNVTTDAGATRAYDAENRMTKAVQAGTTSYYYYDAGSRRSRRVIGGQETWQVYGFEDELVAEYTVGGLFNGGNPPSAGTPAKEYGYRSGQLLVSGSCSDGTHWLVADHLGTPRIELKADSTVATRHDYLPFGEELEANMGDNAFAPRNYPQYGYATGPDCIRQHFTGKERDTESGLDYFGARYYSSTQGRFTGVDPVDFTKYRLANPQAWNKYSYVTNTPLKFTDPSGKIIQFRNEEDAKKALLLFQAGLPKDQRGSVSIGKDQKGNFTLKVDAKAAEKAGADSLLGRLNKAATTERIAVVDFVKRDTKFDIIRFGIASNKETTSFAQEEGKSQTITPGTLTGLTLPEFGDKNHPLFNAIGFNSAEPGKTRILISTEATVYTPAQAIYAETLAHFQTFAETGDARKARHPRVDDDEKKIVQQVGQNEKQK